MGVTDESFLSLFFPIISLIILSWYTEHLSVQLSRFLVLIIIYVSRARIVNTNNISELALCCIHLTSQAPSRAATRTPTPIQMSPVETWVSHYSHYWSPTDIWHYPHLHLQAGVDTGGTPGALHLLTTPGSFLRPGNKCEDQRNQDDTSQVQMLSFWQSGVHLKCMQSVPLRLDIERLIRVMGSWRNPLGFNEDNGITQHETSRVETVGINVFICFLIVSNIPPTCQVKVSLVWASPVPPWLYFPASETVRLWQKYPFCCPPFSCK